MFIALLHEMAIGLGYDFDRIHITNSWYTPSVPTLCCFTSGSLLNDRFRPKAEAHDLPLSVEQNLPCCNGLGQAIGACSPVEAEVGNLP